MTPYKIWRGKKPNLMYLHEFGITCFELNDREHKRKFDPKSDEGLFLGYSPNSRVYKMFNKRSKIVMESTNVVVDDQGTVSWMFKKRSKKVMELANVVVDDQGIVSIGLRSDESETEGPLQRPIDDALTNDATPWNSSTPDTEDASLFTESLF